MFLLAAQSTTSAAELVKATASEKTASLGHWLHSPWNVPEQANLLTWCREMNGGVAMLLICAGIVYLLFGFYFYKWLVTLNAAIVGAFLGSLVGKNGDAAIAGAFMGGFSAAALTWPLMKWAVTVMGGLFGALLGISLWKSSGLEPQYAWSGGLTGLVFFGMASFVVFRLSVMTYTSLQGSAMLIFGMISLIYKYPNAAVRLTDALMFKPFILPAAIFIPMICGMFYQSQTPVEEGSKK